MKLVFSVKIQVDVTIYSTSTSLFPIGIPQRQHILGYERRGQLGRLFIFNNNNNNNNNNNDKKKEGT